MDTIVCPFLNYYYNNWTLFSAHCLYIHIDRSSACILFHCCTPIWVLTNNNYSLYSHVACFSLWLSVNICSCYICIPYLYIVGVLDCWANWHRHISSAEGSQIWLFTFCVVLIQSIVIFKKRGGIYWKCNWQLQFTWCTFCRHAKST